MWLFCGVFGYLSLLLLALSISSALYLLAELAEEYPTIAGIVLKKYLLPAVVAIHIVLWIDGLPTFEVILGLFAHGSYHLLLQNFPLVNLRSFEAPLSALMFVISHYFWFIYFTDPIMYNLPGRDVLHMVGFFSVLVWATPCGLFVSLTISDSVLPGIESREVKHSGIGNHLNSDSRPTYGQTAKRGANIFKTVYDFFQHVVETAADYGYTGACKDRKHKNFGSMDSLSYEHTSNHSSLYDSCDCGTGAQTYPYVSPQVSGQYSASQFATNRKLGHHMPNTQSISYNLPSLADNRKPSGGGKRD